MRGEPNSTSRLNLLPILVEPVTNDRLSTVFVCGDSLGRQGVVGSVLELFVISPVWATTKVSEGDRSIE